MSEEKLTLEQRAAQWLSERRANTADEPILTESQRFAAFARSERNAVIEKAARMADEHGRTSLGIAIRQLSE